MNITANGLSAQNEVGTAEVLALIGGLCRSTITLDQILEDDGRTFVVSLDAAQYSYGCHSLFVKFGAPDIAHEPHIVKYKWVMDGGTVTTEQDLRAEHAYKLQFQLKDEK